MKVREIREVVCRLQALHSRYNAKETVQVLGELATILKGHDDQTVAAFAKSFQQSRQAVNGRSKKQQTRRRARQAEQ